MQKRLERTKSLGFSEVKEGSRSNKEEEGRTYKHMKEVLMEELKNTLRPEIIEQIR